MPVRIQTEDFDLSVELKKLRAGDARVGAVAAFVGTVRDLTTPLCRTPAMQSQRQFPG